MNGAEALSQGQAASRSSHTRVRKRTTSKLPYQVWRERRGLTRAALAERAGLKACYIRALETGEASTYITQLRQLAKALDVTVEDLKLPVRIWRERRGLFQRELAAASGVSVPYICKLENGATPGRPEKLAALAAVLEIAVEDLMPRPDK